MVASDARSQGSRKASLDASIGFAGGSAGSHGYHVEHGALDTASGRVAAVSGVFSAPRYHQEGDAGSIATHSMQGSGLRPSTEAYSGAEPMVTPPLRPEPATAESVRSIHLDESHGRPRTASGADLSQDPSYSRPSYGGNLHRGNAATAAS